MASNASLRHPLAALLPKSVAEWTLLIQGALQLPVVSLWYPEHFYLHQIRSRLRFSPQKQNDVVLNQKGNLGNAVLVLLSPAPTGGTVFQDMCITLTKRTTKVSTHKGQISFPGGHRDEEETALEAAQRETREEIGLDPATYTAIGQLTPIASNSARAPVAPQVAIAESPVCPVCASPNEVDSIHYLHLSTLLLRAAETQSRVIKYRSFSAKEPSYFPCTFASPSQDAVTPAVRPSPGLATVPSDSGFAPMCPQDFPGELVWGLTSFMLCEFTARLAAALEAQHPGVEAAKAVNILQCTNVLARDPEAPAHE